MADRVFGRSPSLSLGLLRIVAGLFFPQHGAQKLLGVFGGFHDFLLLAIQRGGRPSLDELRAGAREAPLMSLERPRRVERRPAPADAPPPQPAGR